MNKPKSFVALEKAVCPVCGTVHETGSILLDKRFRAISEERAVTHYDLCPEHKHLLGEGFIALVEVTEQATRLEDANRTGKVLHIKRELWEHFFDIKLENAAAPMVFVEIGVIDRLHALAAQETAEKEDGT